MGSKQDGDSIEGAFGGKNDDLVATALSGPQLKLPLSEADRGPYDYDKDPGRAVW